MTFQSLKENNHPQIWIQETKIVDYLMIGATIRIGLEILRLPYAGFFLQKDAQAQIKLKFQVIYIHIYEKIS